MGNLSDALQSVDAFEANPVKDVAWKLDGARPLRDSESSSRGPSYLISGV
jgi:hypothetical protein